VTRPTYICTLDPDEHERQVRELPEDAPARVLLDLCPPGGLICPGDDIAGLFPIAGFEVHDPPA
jgi:hypothetical protein